MIPKSLNIFARKQHQKKIIHQGRKTNFIFIHINKTAGTSVGRSLGVNRKNHLTVREAIDSVGREVWESSYTFAFVRNPWAKVVSHYRYRVKTNHTKLQDRPIPFSEWVRKTYGPEKDFYYYDVAKMFQPQSEWVKNHHGEIDIDFIGKFENISSDFEVVKKQVGLKSELLCLNTTDSTPYREYYCPDTIDIVGEWFKEDIDLFDYQF